MKNKKFFGLTAVSVALIGVIFTSSIALARDCDDNNSCQHNSCQDKSCKCDRDCDDSQWGNGPFSKQYRQVALNGDYRQWRNVMWRYGFLSSLHGAVTECNFPRFMEAMRLLDCGDTDGARIILDRMDRNLYTYARGFENGFEAGYKKGWRDAREFFTTCNDGSGRCDAYSVRF